jgi:hypothetical protein
MVILVMIELVMVELVMVELVMVELVMVELMMVELVMVKLVMVELMMVELVNVSLLLLANMTDIVACNPHINGVEFFAASQSSSFQRPHVQTIKLFTVVIYVAEL